MAINAGHTLREHTTGSARRAIGLFERLPIADASGGVRFVLPCLDGVHAAKFVAEMQVQHIAMDSEAWAELLQVYAREGDVDSILDLWYELKHGKTDRKAGPSSYTVVWPPISDALTREKAKEISKSVFPFSRTF